MRGRRSRLQQRDQDSGLVFSWRVALNQNGTFLVALLLVGLATVGLATVVRIRIGDDGNFERRSASVVLVSPEAGGDGLWAMAIEAGPFPDQWNPAADPAYAVLRGEALKQAERGASRYAPRVLEAGISSDPALTADRSETSVLPPLPVIPPRPPIEAPEQTTLGAKVIRSGPGPALMLSRLPVEAQEAVTVSGRRFMIRYAADGRVREVTPLKSDPLPVDLAGWLARGRVTGHDATPGWLVIESTTEP